MAIENEELQQLMEVFRRGLSDLGDSTTGLTEAQKKLKSKIDLTMQGLGGVAKFGTAVGKGETELKAFNGIVDTATTIVGGMAKVIPVWGDAVATFAKGIGEAAKMAVNALDNTAKSFVEIGKVGGLTAKGMSGVREQFIRSGVSLETFQKQIVQNAETLAQFRGLTGAGAEDFATIVGALTQDSDETSDSLRRIGLNADEIASTTAAYIKQQTMLGRAQNASNQELAQGTAQYAKELDIISKITGQNREAIQKQQEAALSENKFRAVYEDMISQGKEKEAKALMGFQTVISGLDKEAGQGLRDLSAGVADTAAAQKILQSTGGAAQDIVNKVTTGQIDQAQAQIELKKALGENITSLQQQARYNKDANETFIGYAAAEKIRRAEFDKFGNVVKEAKTQQAEQTEGSDDLTNSVVKAQKNLERMSQELNLLGFTLLPQAAVVVDAFSTAMRDAIIKVNNALGIGPGPGGAKGAGNEAANKAGAEGKGFFGRMGARFGAEFKYMRGQAAQEQSAADSGNPYAGLPIKQAESTAGGQATEGIIQMARDINSRYGADIKYFSAFNDLSHDNNSAHTKGRAFDLVLNDPKKYPEVEAALSAMGARVIPAARYPDAPHVHAEISAANGFNGMISGPSSGYKPNLTMHGTESISIQPNPNSGSSSPNSDSGIMSQQLAKLEELVSVMKQQVSISDKLLSYSS
jgi:hypothetical protein